MFLDSNNYWFKISFNFVNRVIVSDDNYPESPGNDIYEFKGETDGWVELTVPLPVSKEKILIYFNFASHP